MEKKYTVEKYEKEMSMAEFMDKYVRPEEFIEYCKECSSFGRIWSCPPYDFDVRDYWSRFSAIKCVAYKITYLEQTEITDYSELAEVKTEMHRYLKALEIENEGSAMLSAGSCTLCADKGAGADLLRGCPDDWCARIHGKPCVRPEDLRYSIESIGGDVVGVLKDLFGLEIKWAEGSMMPEYHILLGGLLQL